MFRRNETLLSHNVTTGIRLLVAAGMAVLGSFFVIEGVVDTLAENSCIERPGDPNGICDDVPSASSMDSGWIEGGGVAIGVVEVAAGAVALTAAVGVGGPQRRH